MSKIVIQSKHGKITIINRLSYPETVNERVKNAISSGMFDGFLPVSIKQKRKEIRIECVVNGLLTLNQYFDGMVSKKAFLDFVYQLVLIIKNCEKNMISANNLDLQKDRVFIDPITKSVKCIYWPIVNNQHSNPPHIFLKQLPYDISFNPHEENTYLEQYSSFFDGYNPFSINNFERLLLKLQGRKIDGSSRTPSEMLSGSTANDKKIKSVAHTNVNVEYDPFSNVNVSQHNGNNQNKNASQGKSKFCNQCGAENSSNALFCSACGNKLDSNRNNQQTPPTVDFGTMVLGDNTGGTVVLGFDEPEVPVYPKLTRLKTGGKYSINKPVFRIGTEQAYCDLFISDNTFISRSHADIISRNGRYYIIDRNSTNRTFVDGKVIPKETEVELFDRTIIKLANEEFSFTLE